MNGEEPAVHEIPEFTGGVNGEEAAVHEIPEYTGGVNGEEPAIHEVPEFKGGVNAVEAAVHEVPEYTVANDAGDKDQQPLVEEPENLQFVFLVWKQMFMKFQITLKLLDELLKKKLQ